MDSCIFNGKSHSVISFGDLNADLFPGRGVMAGIADEIAEYLGKKPFIRLNDERVTAVHFHYHINTLFIQQFPVAVQNTCSKICQPDSFRLQRKTRRFHSGHRQYLHHKVFHGACDLKCPLQILIPVLVSPDTVKHTLQLTFQYGNRGFQLMGDSRKKCQLLAFQLLLPFHVFLQKRVGMV